MEGKGDWGENGGTLWWSFMVPTSERYSAVLQDDGSHMKCTEYLATSQKKISIPRNGCSEMQPSEEEQKNKHSRHPLKELYSAFLLYKRLILTVGGTII